MYWSQVKLNTCEPELEMFTRYSKLLAGYMRGVGTDLTTDVSPPKCLYIEVRANRLIGEVAQSRRRPLLGPSPG